MSVSVSVSTSVSVSVSDGSGAGFVGDSGFVGTLSVVSGCFVSVVVLAGLLSPTLVILYAASPSFKFDTIGLPSSPISESFSACSVVRSFPATSSPSTSNVEFLK